MNKNEYLRILSERLSSLPHDEYSNIMQYYTEYFEDAGESNEQKVIEELGSPQSLAEKIIHENMDKNIQTNQFFSQGMEQQYNQNMILSDKKSVNQGLSTGWKVVIAIVTFPIWIGIIAAIGGIAFGFSMAAIACIAAGIVTCVAGISVMGASFTTSLLFVGGGFITVAVALGFVMAVVGIVQLCTKLIKYIFANKSKLAL